MKTSIIVSEFGRGRYARARTPEEFDGQPGRDDLYRVPFYSPPHTATGMNGNGAREWHEPEAVLAARCRFRPSRGKLQKVRMVDAEFVEQLDAIDAQRHELTERLRALDVREQEVCEDAYMRGLPLPVKKVKEWTETRAAARAAAAKE